MGWLKKTFKKISPFSKGGIVGGALGIGGSAIGGYLNNQHNQRGQQSQVPPNFQVQKQYPGGTAGFYDDSWLQILKGLQGGNNTGEMMQNLLQNFSGNPEQMKLIMQQMQPFIAAGMFNDPAYKNIADFEGRTEKDRQQTMQAYGTGAGMIGDQGRQATTMGQQKLGRMGLGRGAASAGLASRVAQQTGAQQGGLFSSLYEGHRNRTEGYAQQSLDATRGLTQMVLTGVSPERSEPQKQSLWGPAIGALGSGVGGLLGGLCWVAREVIPDEWKDVRHYMLNVAPASLFRYYAENGEQIAAHLREHPEEKAQLRPMLREFARQGRAA
jgi:hypothetical protein